MPKTNDVPDAAGLYASLAAEREKRRAALVQGASVVNERERLLLLKERIYGSLVESFDLAEVEDSSEKRGALLQQGTSLLNSYVKLISLCEQRDIPGNADAPRKDRASEPASA